MNNNLRNLRLGCFVLVALVICLASVIVLIGPRLFQPKITAETYFQNSISGLEVGSPVKFRGIQVGQVTDITLSTDAYPQKNETVLCAANSLAVVRMELYLPSHEIEGNIKEYVNQGLRIQTQLAGITGSLYLSMEFLDPEKYPGNYISYGWQPINVYIPSAPSLANEIVDNVKTFLADLDDLDLDKTLSETLPTIQSLLSHLNSILVQVEPQTLSDLGKNLNTLLSTTDKKVASFDVGKLNRFIDQIRSSAKALEETTQKTHTEKLVNSLTLLSGQLNAIVSNNQYDIHQIVLNLNTVIQNLQSFSQEISNDPALLISRQKETSNPFKSKQ